MKSRFIREQKTICGKEYMEVDLLHVSPAEHRASIRRKKAFASSLAMQNCNERNSRRHLHWTVAENFTERKNHTQLVHLTYAPEWLPLTEEEAERIITNFIDKLNRRQAKKYAAALKADPSNPGGVLRKVKYIVVTEWQHEDKAACLKEVRYHHHMILECDLTTDEIKDCWSTGRGKWREPLGLVKCDRAEFNKGSLAAYCEYITKNPKRRRRWRQSQGLRRPTQPRPNDGRYTPKKLAEAATLYIDDAQFWENRYGTLKLGRGQVWQYAFTGAEARYNEITGEWHVTATFWADPRRQPKGKAHGRKAGT